MFDDLGYTQTAFDNIRRVKEEQADNIRAAGRLMADAVEADKLISVYGGGGHTTLVMGEMFFRAGGLSNINPIMETGLSVFNQALKYLELERCVNRRGTGSEEERSENHCRFQQLLAEGDARGPLHPPSFRKESL